MERETGVEPATSSLGSWHSTTELLPLASKRKYTRPAPAHQSTRTRNPPPKHLAKIGLLIPFRHSPLQFFGYANQSRRNHCPWSTPSQPQEPYARDPAQQTHSHHRRLGLGQILARLRHNLR